MTRILLAATTLYVAGIGAVKSTHRRRIAGRAAVISLMRIGG
jgi:hypothetical protein